LLDEPQTNLDKAGRQLLERAIQAHLVGGGTVVIAAHQSVDLGSASVSRLMLGMD
jgi:ABC-type transport system involved in cytochrome c biogenesis ATPase subunit